MKKNILIIDDSALMRRVLSDIINSDERFTVSETVPDGAKGLECLLNKFYDCTVLDINMPKMDGLQLLEQIKIHKIRTKVIIVSTVAKEGASQTIRALELGAFDFITKPESLYEIKSEIFHSKLLDAIGCATQQLMAVDSEIASLPSSANTSSRLIPSHVFSQRAVFENSRNMNKRKIVAIACSTGGPKALQTLVSLFPKNLDAPILVVQHMPAGFTYSLASRLNEISPIMVKEAEDGDILEKGKMYIAKGGSHLKVRKNGSGSLLELGTEAAINGLRPCADIMYRSLCDSIYDEITCVVLTGMGSDGTKGILELDQSKSIYVIAQDMETSTVYGMPKAIAKAEVVDEIQPLQKITDAIVKHVGVQ